MMDKNNKGVIGYKNVCKTSESKPLGIHHAHQFAFQLKLNNEAKTRGGEGITVFQ